MRRYNRHHGNLVGVKEDPELCVVEMWDEESPYSIDSHQCPNKRRYGENGLFCRFHANKIENDIYVTIPKDVEVNHGS